MKNLIRKILREEVEKTNNFNPTVIFIAGCSSASECGKVYKYSHKEQGNMLQSALGTNFNVITLSHVPSPLSEIKKHNNPYVVMFSAGGKWSNSVANEIKNTKKDLNKIYIVEPCTCVIPSYDCSNTKKNVEKSIENGVPLKNVYGGKTDCTGKNVAGKIDSKSTHWSALTTVGNDIKSIWEKQEQERLEKERLEKEEQKINNLNIQDYSPVGTRREDFRGGNFNPYGNYFNNEKFN